MKRNKFSLSHYKLFSMGLGHLVPLTWYEVLPGDTIQMSSRMLIRLAPLLAPVMHPLRVRIHHWFVPIRLLWDGFEDFITGGDDGDDNQVHPYITLGTVTEGSLHDYLGIPPATYTTVTANALPFRAYQLILNRHYLDQDLSTIGEIGKDEGLDGDTNQSLHSICWGKDYFTTARPWEEKGTEVQIPVEGYTDVIKDPATSGVPSINVNGSPRNLRHLTGTNYFIFSGAAASSTNDADWDDPKLVGDATNLGIDVSEFRLAMAMNNFQQMRARYGSRYTEYLRSLGVKSSDGRLQEPEYLGGGRQVVQFSEVLQTAEGVNDVGTLRGHGLAALKSNKWRRFFDEHGIVMTLASVLPQAVYGNAMHRAWFRSTKEDYFQPQFQHIGQQVIYNKEVYSEHSSPDDAFGYQDRYDEYRSLHSTIGGEFRSTLDHMHMARIFASDPALNGTFVTCQPTDRIFASTSEDPLRCMAYHSIQARRLLHKDGRPY